MNARFDFGSNGKRRQGICTIIERDFQMQLGRDGYKVEVVASDDYTPGTILYLYPFSVWKTGR